MGARAAGIWGRRRVFIFGLLAFAVTSLAGGLATNGTRLNTARPVQGIGAAALAPATFTILITTYPEGRARARALGIWSSAVGAGRYRRAR